MITHNATVEQRIAHIRNKRPIPTAVIGSYNISDKLTPDTVYQPIDVDDVYDYDIVGDIRQEKYVCLVIFRNQECNILRCLQSIILNNIHNIGIVIIDDMSSDNSYSNIIDFISTNNIANTTIVRTKSRYGKVCNYYMAHHKFISDNSIVVLVDGDDYLLSNQINVFNVLDSHYDNGSLATYGSYDCTDKKVHPVKLMHSMDFRHPWDSDRCSAWIHLRTYKNYLFKKIPKYYFKEKDNIHNWLVYGEDNFVNPFIIEFAYPNVVYIRDSLYMYETGTGEHCFNDAVYNIAYICLNSLKLPINIYGSSIVYKYYNKWSEFLIDKENNTIPLELVSAFTN